MISFTFLKDILYGYVRHDPLIGLDYIIDILLVYRKYEGRKMTVPVRRHAYVRNTYTHMAFREDTLNTSIFVDVPEKYKLAISAENGANMVNKQENEGTPLDSDINMVRRLINAILPDFGHNGDQKQKM